MKQIFFAAALLCAVVSCTTPAATTTTPEVTTQVGISDLAYVSMERVISQSDLFQSEGMKLQKRTEAAQRDWSLQEQKLQNDAMQLQQKYQNGLITSTNAQIEQQKIEKRVEEYRTTTQKEMALLEEENTVFASRTQKLINDAVKSINADKRYKMIVNASALIDADSTLDISAIILDEVNRLYKEEKK